MLRFTPEQSLAVNTARSAFNRTQTAMATDLVGNAAPIPLDAWRRIDSRGATIQRDVLAVFGRLAAANQTPIQIADLVNYFPKISDSGEVHVSLDGRSEARQDQALVKYEGTPTPIIDSYARFGWRQMEMIRKGGGMIDMETIANHQRRVAEKLEDMALNGLPGIVVAGQTIYGLRTFPNRSTGTHGFTLTTATGAQWLTAFTQLINLLIADNSFGKVTVFLNWGDYTAASLNEYAAGYPKTILARLREIEQVQDIVPASKIPTGNIIGVNNLATGEWGSILSAMPMTTRPKARHNPEDDYVFGVMAAAAPQFRSDYSDRSHIAHTTTA
jgi:hypothetical protein